jgi:hypothetical protein
LQIIRAIYVKSLKAGEYPCGTKGRMLALFVNEGERALMMEFSFKSRFLPVVSFFICLATSGSANALTMSAGAGLGYEVLSYRDSSTKIVGGSVSSGDAFDQTSFTGLQYGVNGFLGLMRLNAMEPLLGVDVTQSQLKKKASDSAFTTSGTFSFLNGGISVGTRLWMSRELTAHALVGFSQALSNSMMSKKSNFTTGETLSDVTYEVAAHKRTSLQLGLAYSILQNALLLGLDLKVGSGCFDCTAPSAPKQPRAYLTRSGAFTLAWMLGDNAEKSPSELDETEFENTAPHQSPNRGAPVRPPQSSVKPPQSSVRPPQSPAKLPAKKPGKLPSKNKQKLPALEDSFND